MSVPVRFVLLAASSLAAGGMMCGKAYAEDPEVRALRGELAAMRREVAQMRQEMLAQKHERHHATRVSARGANATRPAHDTESAAHGVRIADAGPEVTPVFSEVTPRRPPGPRRASEGRLSPTDLPAESWAAFRAATNENEEVQIGGIRVGFPNWRPTISSSDSVYAFSAGILAQLDFGGFLGAGPRAGEGKGKFPSFAQNARRIRPNFTWRYRNWVLTVTPEFGSSTTDGSVGLFEASLNYTRLRNTVLTVGYFQPRMEEESAERSGAFEFLERPAIVDIVRNIASGAGRFSIGGEHHEKRWLANFYFTGQKFGDRNKDSTITDTQTGAVTRIAGRPYASRDIDVHVGAGATAAFKVSQNTNGRQYTLTNNTEIPLGETNLLTSGVLSNVAQIWAAGPQLAVRWKKLLVKGEYYHIGVLRGRQDGGGRLPSLGFDGWYVAANYTLLGHGRGYNSQIAAFTTPGVEYDFDPVHNHWGALEVSGRWSVADMSDLADQGGKGVNGNQQTSWQAGFNWYPNRHIKFMLDYERYIVSRSKGVSGGVNLFGRNGNVIVGRVQTSF
ncbi:OprO/OprP family phosphate-selective porin [Acetobacter sp. AN02]|uniref:OprO/OprP family phosphate-selective porin n=1 Tax=Acetobacter sp. AN02 TaxID=2894186 RepID=UPI0024340C1F|nr:porin [Acetobacter sp. AN02]MDG6093866.1 OprO/OprP family phosphate-selective porin [Acetobacter sp. AN02]